MSVSNTLTGIEQTRPGCTFYARLIAIRTIVNSVITLVILGGLQTYELGLEALTRKNITVLLKVALITGITVTFSYIAIHYALGEGDEFWHKTWNLYNLLETR